MSRPCTGTVDWRPNANRPGTYCWHARYTRADGSRTKWEALDESIGKDDEDGARTFAAEFASLARATTRDGAGETLASYSARWLADRKTRLVSIRNDESRLRDHVLPIVGHRSVLTLDRNTVESVRDALDGKVTAGELSWKTARLAWSVFRTMCSDMANARRRELRVRDTDPAQGIKPTLRGVSPSKQFIFPSEFLQLMACELVPRDWRIAVALALFTYGRDGEVAMLDWRDVDLEHGLLTITRARNRDTGAAKSTKTGGTRRFTIEPNLLPMLSAMHAKADGKGKVFALDATHLSRTLRRWLLVAGVDRPALHDRTKESRPVTWHDLRASAATWMAIRGDRPLAIQSRCGHESFSTTEIYIRQAETIVDGFGEPFPAFRHPFVSDGIEPKKLAAYAHFGAGHESRTRDLRLGKPTLYQLS
jgi:integrase